MAGIASVIRERVGGNPALPESDESNPKWLRFPCPFCGRDRAAINYRLNLFACYHADCMVTLSARHRNADPAGELAHRFQLQIDQAVRNRRVRLAANRMTGQTEDLRQYAYQRLIEYDQSGELDDWREQVKNDPDQLDRFVLQALNGDLGNWIAKGIRARKGEQKFIRGKIQETRERGRTRTKSTKAGTRSGFGISEIRSEDESPEDIAIWLSWPTLEGRFRYGLTIREIAEARGQSVRTTNRRYAKEFADAARTYRGETR